VNGYQLAWTLYALGGFGCGVAAWLLFRRFGREWAHFFMVTAWVLLLTPYALEAENMVMAPALFIIVMDGLTNGFDTVKSITMLLLGLWLVALVVSLLFLLTARHFAKPIVRVPGKLPAEELSDEETQTREELLEGEMPLRAER
jgi:hypothetical protein